MRFFLDSLRACIRRKPKPKRLEVRFVTWFEGDRLIREEGWQLAVPEEDRNHVLGWVWIERVEKPERLP